MLENEALDKAGNILSIEEEAKAINNKTSKYNKINHLILMREILLGKF
jgi:hypothetical protein